MSFYRHLVLALLTFLLLTTVLPVAAEYSIYPHHLTSLPNSHSITLLEQGKQLYDGGRFALAAQLWEQAVMVFEQRGERRNQATSYNYLAIVYQDLGQWEASTRAIAQVLNLLQTTDDPLLHAHDKVEFSLSPY